MDTKKLLLVGGLGVVAVVGFIQLQKMTAPAPVQTDTPAPQIAAQVEYADVLVASVDIPLGTRLNEEQIGWKKWPVEALTPALIDSNARPDALEELRSAVTRTAIYEGEPIIDRKVIKTGERGQMSALLNPGMRAISTQISMQTAAGGFIQPGDRVDVVLTEQIRTGNQSNSAARRTSFVSSTIFENVKVLAIGTNYNSNDEDGAFATATTAVLELSQADSEILIEAESKGELSLTLRGLDRGQAGIVPSAAVNARKKASGVSSLTIYRDGQPQVVAIQGQ
jgi:pilus assembly protein CpaB